MYEKKWNAAEPGCLVILVDQSTSMRDPFPTAEGNVQSRKCDQVAKVVNDLLAEAIKRCEKNGAISPRVDIGVLRYGAQVGHAIPGMQALTSVQEVAIHRRLVSRTQRQYDRETSTYIEYPVQQSVWLDPIGDGPTPMNTIMNQAYLLIDTWSRGHSSSFPPVIVNVTDGESTDGDPTQAAKQLTTISTNDGQALLFNCHIASGAEPEIVYPCAVSELRTTNRFAALLFEMSSIIPEPMRIQATQGMGMNIRPGARGFVFNGGMQSVLQMLAIASSGIR